MSAPLPPRARLRRWLTLAGRALLLAALLLLLLAALLQTQAVRGLLLRQAGAALGLELAAGDIALGLRGELRLVLADAVIRGDGDDVALLRARRILVSLPWASLRSFGDALILDRIELDAPRLHLPALQRWLASRPPSGKTRIPAIRHGLRLREGRIDNDDWRIENLSIDLPRLQPTQPAQLAVRGRYLASPLSAQAALTLAVDSPQALLDARITRIVSAGHLTLRGEGWSLPAQVVLSGPLQLGRDSVLLRPVKLGIAARYRAGSTVAPFRLGLFGPMAFNEASWRFVPVTVVLAGDGPVPDAQARGSVSVGKRLVLHLDGALDGWPAAWPPLPLPASSAPLRFALDYKGAPDLIDAIALSLRREATRFDARLRLPQLQAWLDAGSQGSPLPPLAGTLSTPRVTLDGAALEGVEIELDDSP